MSNPENTISQGDDDLEILPLQLSPLDGWNRARGAYMGESAGYDMALHYGDSAAEQAWVNHHAGLMDVSHMGQLILTGEGVEQALASLPGVDFPATGTGRIITASARDEEEELNVSLLLTRRAEDVYIIAGAADKYDLSAWLFGILPDDATVNLMDEQALLALRGPDAQAVLAQLVPGTENIAYGQAAAFGWQGNGLWISRTGTQQQDGYEISLPGDAAADFATALCALDGVKPVGLLAGAGLMRGDIYHRG